MKRPGEGLKCGRVDIVSLYPAKGPMFMGRHICGVLLLFFWTCFDQRSQSTYTYHEDTFQAHGQPYFPPWNPCAR